MPSNLTLRSRWYCDIPNTDLNSWLFTSPTHPLPDTLLYTSCEKPETHVITLSAQRRLVKRLAHGFIQAGLKEGDRVLLFSSNNIYFPAIFLGIVAAGGIFTGANPAFTSRELGFQLKNSGAKFCLANIDAFQTAVKAVDEIGMKREDLFVFDDEFILGMDRGKERWITRCEEEQRKYRVRHWSALVSDYDGFEWRKLSTEEEVARTAAINYSSGTTGVPKGVELTHKNFISNTEQVITLAKLSPAKDALPRRLLCILPMYHAYGQTFFVLHSPKRGYPSFIAKKFEFLKFLDYIQRYHITNITAVPPILIAMAKHPAVSSYDLSSVRAVGCGAAPLSHDIMKEVEARFDFRVNVRQGWGMTETTCSVLGHHPDDEEDDGSVGELNPNCEGQVVDAETGTRSLPANERGEIWVRSPNVCKGYYNNPQATAETFAPGGWLKTGDIGYYTPSGKWYVVDRKKELIKVKGNQVAPAELEGILLEHPGIADAAVIGLPFAGDERPRAYIVPTPELTAPLTADDVTKWVQDKCTRYKWITGGVMFLESIPKNPSGKILRRELRDRAKREVVNTNDFRAKL